MKDKNLLRKGVLITGFVLMLMLQMLLHSSVNAQGCGTLFLSGGAQNGGYAGGGNAKYVPTATTDTMQINSSWNMISVPRIVGDFTTGSLFPTAISNAFWYNNGYLPKSTLENGKGYWLKFSSVQEIPISGYDLLTLAIPTAKGWNMIGSLSAPIPASSIISDPPGMIVSQCFGYDHGYQGYDTLLPGKGFWIKVNSPGVLTLSANFSNPMLMKNAVRIVPTNEMPPPPPDGSPAMELAIPNEYQLEQAYPNPFNPTTTIKYSLPSDSKVNLKVYNPLGQVVAVLVNEPQTASYKSVEWNAGAVSSGVYFYKLEATSVADPSKSFTQVKKLILLK